MTELLDRLDRMRGLGADRIEIADAVGLWAELAETIGLNGRAPVTPLTMRMYRNLANRHLLPAMGPVMLSEVDTRFVARLRNELLDRTTRVMAGRALACLHGCLEECRILGLIDANPAAGLLIGPGGRRRPPIAVPSREDARAMLLAADRLAASDEPHTRRSWMRYRPIVYLLRFTGMRVGEILGLPWRAVDAGAGQIRVFQSANALREIAAPKSAWAFRTIDIAPKLSDMLTEWRASCPESLHGLVFPMPDGGPQKHASLASCAWLRLSKEAAVLKPNGKPRYSRRVFRHLFASELIEKGATIKELQVVMGHASAQFTLQHYGHLLAEKETLERRQQRIRQIAEENWP